MNKFAFAAVAAALSLAVPMAFAATAPAVDPALAAMNADQLVSARQAAMKQDGGILRNAGTLTGADAEAAAMTLLQNFVNFPVMFANGATNADSEALPIIWTEYDKFTAIFARDQASAQAMLTAAQSGDVAGYAAAVKDIGSTCGECHQTYRKPH